MSEGKIAIIDGSPPQDESAWADIVNAKLDGVGFHTAMYSQCLGGGLCDMAKLHRRHAVDEYKELLRLVEEYVRLFGKPPRFSMRDAGVPASVDSDKQAFEVYEDWETEAFEKLRSARSKMTGDKQLVTTLVHNVMEELENIEKMR